MTASKHVAVVTPIGETCATGYAMSLVHMAKLTALAVANPDGLADEHLAAGAASITDFTVTSYSSSILPMGRQLLAKDAMERGATHLLWIDSDMTFPPDTLLRWAALDLPLVGINALSRRPPYRCTAKRGPDESLDTTPDSTGLEKAWRMGFGMVWMAVEILERMPLPWFAFEWVPDSYIFRGEDYSFFDKARTLGYEAMVDHNLSKEVRHMGSMGFSPMMTSMGE